MASKQTNEIEHKKSLFVCHEMNSRILLFVHMSWLACDNIPHQREREKKNILNTFFS